MDEETKKKVKATVMDILRESFTESKVRAAAAERLGIDLSAPDCKLFIRGVFEGYLRSLLLQEEEEREAENQGGTGGECKGKPEEKQDENEKGGDGRKRERDDAGDLILCRLATNRRVTLSEFRDKKLVSIRESYLKDGKELPTSKDMAAGHRDCPELLDPRLDQRHRSYLSVVRGQDLGVLRPRVPLELLRVDERWIPRLRAAGLLPLCRLVEGNDS